MAIVNLGRVVATAETIPPADIADAAKISGKVFSELKNIIGVRTGTEPPAEAVPHETTVVASSRDANGAESVAIQPMRRYVLFALVCLAGGLGGGLALQQHYHAGMSHLPVLPANFGVFALLYIMAQAIERLLVPVSWFGGGFLGGVGTGSLGRRSKSALVATHQAAMVEAYQSPSQTTAQCAADSLHDMRQYSANLTATTFGLAALAAMLVSGYTGLFLLHIVGLHTVAWLEVGITGLAVAGGTKPLHDLISNISASGKTD